MKICDRTTTPSPRRVRIFLRLISLSIAVAMVTTMSVSAAEIHVMSGGAPKEVFAQLTPKFEQQTGIKVEFTYAVIAELREKLGAGATAGRTGVANVDARQPRQGRQAAHGRPCHLEHRRNQRGGERTRTATGYFKHGKVSRRDVGCPLSGSCDAEKNAERHSLGQGDGAARYRRRRGKEGNPQSSARRRRAIGGGGVRPRSASTPRPRSLALKV